MSTARNFNISVKPAWEVEKIEKLVKDLRGTAVIFAITHDKDIDDSTGELIEPHTHFSLEYETPRKIGTVANLFGVEPNFVEITRSKKAFLRYLTHKDDTDKFQYDDQEVITNSEIAYADYVMGANLSDKEIAQHIMEGRGLDLMGIVSATKLRTIQAFLQFDRSGMMVRELKLANERLELMQGALDNINAIAIDFQTAVAKGMLGLKDGIIDFTHAMKQIAEIAAVRR